jgi:hypothetical protein
MARLGVIDAFQETVELCWRRLPALIRFAWAPALLATVVAIGIEFTALPRVIAAMQALPKDANGAPNEAALNQAMPQIIFDVLLPLYIPMLIVWLIAAVMINVPTVGLAAGEEQDGFFFIRWSGRHTRYAFAVIVQWVFAYGIGAAIVATLVHFGYLANPLDALAAMPTTGKPTPEQFVTMQTAMSSVRWVFYLAIGFFNAALVTFPAIAVAENRLDIWSALKTGIVHFFPILAVQILIFLARLVFMIGFFIAIFLLMLLLSVVAHGLAGVIAPPAAAAIVIGVVLAVLIAMLVFDVFYYALSTTISGVVYRRLSAESA